MSELTPIARVEDTYAAAVSWSFGLEMSPDLLCMQERQRAEFQAAIAQAKADAWAEGVTTALNHAIRNDDGTTLRLEHLDGRPWANPYKEAEG